MHVRSTQPQRSLPVGNLQVNRDDIEAWTGSSESGLRSNGPEAPALRRSEPDYRERKPAGRQWVAPTVW